MKRKRRGDDGGGDSWLNTYADMVTLLLTFFVLLLSISTVSQEKFNAFIRSFAGLLHEEYNESGSFGDPPDLEEDALTELYLKLSSYVSENHRTETVFIMQTDEIIYVRFNSSAFFEPDQYVFREGGREIVEFIGGALKEYEDDIELVTVFGHTATADTPVSDWMLSGARAAVVAMHLEDEQNFDHEKLVILGYGNNFPIEDNSTEEGRRANRRVELAIIGKKSKTSFDPYGVLAGLYDTHDFPKSGGLEDILVPSTAP